MKCCVPGWAAKALTSTPLTLALVLVIGAWVITSRQTAAQQPGSVSLHDNFFDPATIDVAAGTTIMWDNAGQGGHTVTSDAGVFDSGQEKSQWLSPGQTFSFTFPQAGTYPYHCALHGAAGGVGMSGTVVVDNPPQVPATAAPQTEPPPTLEPTPSSSPSPRTQTPIAPSASNVVTPTSPTTPIATSQVASSGGHDIVWILLGVGGVTIVLGAAAAVSYGKRKRRT